MKQTQKGPPPGAVRPAAEVVKGVLAGVFSYPLALWLGATVWWTVSQAAGRVSPRGDAARDYGATVLALLIDLVVHLLMVRRSRGLADGFALGALITALLTLTLMLTAAQFSNLT